ncbi:hypothetical protein Zm00014a_027816 [Zea mays]|nr:hypothetical protein Zm00014a_027816 [Zea mays]PWZ08308.1 hypothetical protein Zm00014a_027816 [Zea mays]PWZ08309.1 hypothetical protein Zm00014a_027816 [Zea mays]PWZ08310.1 hypothetical protein Zm00014a_027816 [Zea mays]PWZ08311.1 hypothetical protein Zm00014a_027816 [Zea mays]
MAAVDLSKLVKEKRFWVASFLVVWAAALQGHMMWMQRQDTFKHKFGIDQADGPDAQDSSSSSSSSSS